MQRNVTSILLAILACSLNALAQQPVASPTTSRATPPGPQSHRPEVGRQPQGPTAAAPWNNAEVIRLVQSQVPESIIIADILRSTANYDLSAAGLKALRDKGVSQKIIDAMKEAMSPRRGGELKNGQKGPAKTLGSSAASRAIKLGPPKTSAVVKNPKASQADPAIIVVLKKQRQAADAQAAQMKMVTRPVGQNSLTAGQTQSAGGFTDPNKSGSPAAQAQPKSSTSGNKATAAMPAMVQRPPTKEYDVPSQTSDVTGNSASSMLVHATQLPTTALTCAHDPTLRIINVSGESYPATFTQDAAYNFYTITGCSFGDPGPNAKVYIYYQDTFHQEFQIQEWNDNGIKLNLDPNLRGVEDHDNLTLVVQRSDGKQTSKPGFKFYAARETTRLASIPRNSFSLDQFTLNNISNLSLFYTSPSSAAEPPNFRGKTVEVQWSTKNASGQSMNGGEDVYQFKQLQPGFSADAAQMSAANTDCGGDPFVNLGGNFGLKWVGDDLHASWQAQFCQSVNCGGAFQGDCFTAPPSSSYAVDVWVTGPRGVDPWTGKPN